MDDKAICRNCEHSERMAVMCNPFGSGGELRCVIHHATVQIDDTCPNFERSPAADDESFLIDKPLPEDAEINAAHPVNNLKNKTSGPRWDEAMRLVGAKHSKAALVELVNWLLWRIDEQGNAGRGRD